MYILAPLKQLVTIVSILLGKRFFPMCGTQCPTIGQFIVLYYF